MSAYRVIDKMEIVVREGVWLPFGWRAVNADQVLDLVEKLRSTLPEDGGRSKKAGDGDSAPVDAAPKEAVGMRAVGAAAAGDGDIIARAQAKADELIADAQNAAREIRRGADEYADNVLASLDSSLGKALAAVQKGRQQLASQTTSTNGKSPREMSTL